MGALPESYPAGSSGHLAHHAAIGQKLNGLVLLANEDGAVLDGETDDTADIQSVIDRAPDEGATILFTGLAGVSGDIASGIRMGLRIPSDKRITFAGVGVDSGLTAVSSDPQILVRDEDETLVTGFGLYNMALRNNTEFDPNGCRGLRLYRFLDCWADLVYFENNLTIAVEVGIANDYESSGFNLTRYKVAGVDGKIPFSGFAAYHACDLAVLHGAYDAIARPFDLEVGNSLATVGVRDFVFAHATIRNGSTSTESATNSYAGVHLTTQNGAYIRDGLIDDIRCRDNENVGSSEGGEVLLLSTSGEIDGVDIRRFRSRGFHTDVSGTAAVHFSGSGVKRCGLKDGKLLDPLASTSLYGVRLDEAVKCAIEGNDIWGAEWDTAYAEYGTSEKDNRFLWNPTDRPVDVSALDTTKSTHVRARVNEWRVNVDAFQGGADNQFATGDGTAGMHGSATARPTISGSRGGNAALADVLTKGAAKGFWIDSTTA